MFTSSLPSTSCDLNAAASFGRCSSCMHSPTCSTLRVSRSAGTSNADFQCFVSRPEEADDWPGRGTALETDGLSGFTRHTVVAELLAVRPCLKDLGFVGGGCFFPGAARACGMAYCWCTWCWGRGVFDVSSLSCVRFVVSPTALTPRSAIESSSSYINSSAFLSPIRRDVDDNGPLVEEFFALASWIKSGDWSGHDLIVSRFLKFSAVSGFCLLSFSEERPFLTGTRGATGFEEGFGRLRADSEEETFSYPSLSLSSLRYLTSEYTPVSLRTYLHGLQYSYLPLGGSRNNRISTKIQQLSK